MINLDDARLGPMHGLVGIAEGRTKSALARGGTTARRKPTRRTRLTSTTFEEKSVPQEAVCDVDAFALHVVATVLQAAVAQLTCGSTQEESAPAPLTKVPSPIAIMAAAIAGEAMQIRLKKKPRVEPADIVVKETQNDEIVAQEKVEREKPRHQQRVAPPAIVPKPVSRSQHKEEAAQAEKPTQIVKKQPKPVPRRPLKAAVVPPPVAPRRAPKAPPPIKPRPALLNSNQAKNSPQKLQQQVKPAVQFRNTPTAGIVGISSVPRNVIPEPKAQTGVNSKQADWKSEWAKKQRKSLSNTCSPQRAAQHDDDMPEWQRRALEVSKRNHSRFSTTLHTRLRTLID